MQMNRNYRRPQHPVARSVMLKGPHQAYGHDRNAELLRHAEPAVLELIHSPVARPFRLRKNNQARASIDGILRQPPHALQVRRTPHIRYRHVTEALHQPAVGGNLEVRFQLPPPHKLRNRAVQHERIEKIHVVGHEEARPAGIKTGRANYFQARAGQKCDPTAKRSLQPIVLAGIEKNPQEHQRRRNDEKMQPAESPKYSATDRKPGLPHMKTSTAARTTSSERHSSVATSPSIITSTGAASLNSTWRTARREASGCLMCEPSYRRGNVRSSPSRPIGPQRTNSMRPSVGSASGAISIVPPVYLLLLNVRKRERRSSHSASSSQRKAKDRRRNCTTRTKTPSK